MTSNNGQDSSSADGVLPVRRFQSLPVIPPASSPPHGMETQQAQNNGDMQHDEFHEDSSSSPSSSNELTRATSSRQRASVTPLSMVAESAASAAISDVEDSVVLSPLPLPRALGTTLSTSGQNTTDPLSDTETHSDVVLESPTTSTTSRVDMTGSFNRIETPFEDLNL